MTPRATPFERDIQRMIDALTIELPRVAAADEALVRRIVRPDTAQSERVNVHTSAISDPTADEAGRRWEGQMQREQYRDSMLEIWTAIKAHRRDTDDVLRNEPLKPHGQPVCETRKGTPTACTNYASTHTNPLNGMIVEDLCDDCWLNLCARCYVRPMAEYRPTCDACRKRDEREKASSMNVPDLQCCDCGCRLTYDPDGGPGYGTHVHDPEDYQRCSALPSPPTNSAIPWPTQP